MLTSIKSALGESHSKIILFGEHAVVYGKSAIAIPFPLKISTKVNEIKGEIVIASSLYSGPLENAPREMQGVCNCIKEALIRLDRPLKNLRIQFESEIPMGRGLGSSAAAATSVAKALYNFFNEELDQEELYHLVGLSETYAHGKPSGIDMMTVTSDVPILYSKLDGTDDIYDDKEFILVVADTGLIGNTKEAISIVKKNKDRNDRYISKLINRIDDITKEAKNAMVSGDSIKLGALMSENHKYLKELGVSNAILDKLVDMAIHSGAHGAKLTGGGLGGCMIAVAPSREVGQKIASQLRYSGAKNVWCFSTKEEIILRDK